MKELAAQAMRDGAFGLSTGLFYVPGNFTPTEEVIELAKVVGSMGGIHISHMREEASHVLDSVRETIRIGEEGGLPTQITHHKMIGQPSWGKSVESLKLVEEARARGVDVTIDQYPYTASSTGIAALVPQWALEGGQKSTARTAGRAGPARADQGGDRAESESGSRRGRSEERGDRQLRVRPDAGGQESGRHSRSARGAEPTMENAAETVMDLVNEGRLLGGLSRDRRRGRGAHHAVAVHHDRVRWRYPGVRPGGAASAQLWHVRARARRLCAREERAHAGRCGAPDVGLSRRSG